MDGAVTARAARTRRPRARVTCIAWTYLVPPAGRCTPRSPTPSTRPLADATPRRHGNLGSPSGSAWAEAEPRGVPCTRIAAGLALSGPQVRLRTNGVADDPMASAPAATPRVRRISRPRDGGMRAYVGCVSTAPERLAPPRTPPGRTVRKCRPPPDDPAPSACRDGWQDPVRAGNGLNGSLPTRRRPRTRRRIADRPRCGRGRSAAGRREDGRGRSRTRPTSCPPRAPRHGRGPRPRFPP